VAAAIAGQVQATLTPEQQATLQRNPVIDPDAYQAYLRAVAQGETIDGLQKSVAYLRGLTLWDMTSNRGFGGVVTGTSVSPVQPHLVGNPG